MDPWGSEQIKRTIKEATVKKFYYNNYSVLDEYLQLFIDVYNYAQPLKALKGGLRPMKKFAYICRVSKVNFVQIESLRK